MAVTRKILFAQHYDHNTEQIIEVNRVQAAAQAARRTEELFSPAQAQLSNFRVSGLGDG
jgi:hypothetical protein